MGDLPATPAAGVSVHPGSSFFAALRPFSLVVALATCSLGASLAAFDGQADPLLVCLVLCAGILLQAGVNLLNDRADLARLEHTDTQRKLVERNARYGALFIAIACAIGLVFIQLRGLPMFLLGLVGVFGAWSYVEGPINFKDRGLGFVAVFFLTGVMMVGGVYYALTGLLSWRVLWFSLPFSVYASLLLLANELRDYERDLSEGQLTFSVRFGRQRGARLYRFLVAVLVLATAWLAVASGLALLALSLVALMLLLQPLRLLDLPATQRAMLAKQTGRCYSIFAIVFVGMLWVAEL